MAPSPRPPIEPVGLLHLEALERLRIGSEEVHIAGDELRRLQLQWIKEAQSWLLLHKHGGGIRKGSAASSEPFLKAESTSLPTLSSDLIPTSFPAASTRDLKKGAVFSLDNCKLAALDTSPQIRQTTPATNGAFDALDSELICSPRGADHLEAPIGVSAKLTSMDTFASGTIPLNTGSSQPSSPSSSVRKISVKEQEEQRKAAAKKLSDQRKRERRYSFLAQRTLSEMSSDARSILERFVSGNVFKIGVGAAILTNVVAVGVEAEYLATHPEEKGASKVFDTVQLAYSIFFLLELLLRLAAQRLLFFTGAEWSWNIFDAIVVFSAILETLASNTMNMTHVRVVRLIRVTRLIRSIRVLKMVRFIRALRTLVQSIVVTLKHVMWSLLLLLMIVYGFGVAFAQAVVDSCSSAARFRSHLVASGCSDSKLEIYWGSLPISMFTLFKSVTGGLNWHEPVEALGQISAIWVSLFVVYVTFTVFAVLNVVTGVFCQSAIESVQEDKEVKTMQIMANRGLYEEALAQLFDEIDVNGSEDITLDEFETALGTPKVQAFFESLEIRPSDAWVLFKLLDTNNSNSIDRREFLMGCIQFRGGAKAIDIAHMAHDYQATVDMLDDCMQHFDEQLQRVLDALHEIQNKTDKAQPQANSQEAQQKQKRCHSPVPRKWKSSFELDAYSKRHLAQIYKD